MVPPQNNALSPQPPKLSAQKHILLIHMHKNRVVLSAQSPYVSPKAESIEYALHGSYTVYGIRYTVYMLLA